MVLRKYLSLMLAISITCFQMAPVFAGYAQTNFVINENNVAPCKTLVHANNVLPLVFVDDFNANQSEIGMQVKFKLDKNFVDSDGDELPAGTLFYGKIDDLAKSKMFFKKASAHIIINKMVLPDGREFIVDARPEKETLTSPVIANAAKGTVTAAAAAGAGIIGAMVIAVECLSVGGLMFAPYTGAAVGIVLAGTSKGVNFKVPAGTQILIKFDKPVNIYDI